MPTVIIRKHPSREAIEVLPDTVRVNTNEKVTFRIEGDGLHPGTKITVSFHREYQVLPVLRLRRGASRRGPFRKKGGEARNPEEGLFEFTAAGELETGEVEDTPGFFAHVWKYDVSWTGLPDLDPMIRIEGGD